MRNITARELEVLHNYYYQKGSKEDLKKSAKYMEEFSELQEEMNRD